MGWEVFDLSICGMSAERRGFGQLGFGGVAEKYLLSHCRWRRNRARDSSFILNCSSGRTTTPSMRRSHRLSSHERVSLTPRGPIMRHNSSSIIDCRSSTHHHCPRRGRFISCHHALNIIPHIAPWDTRVDQTHHSTGACHILPVSSLGSEPRCRRSRSAPPNAIRSSNR